MLEENAIHGLWVGRELSKLEQLTIRSFLRQGHPFNLWVYDDLDDEVPDGVILRDAATILPRERIFLKEQPDPGSAVGKKSYGPFSDLFRYKLLHDQGGIWVDMDLTCLRPFDFEDDYLFRSHRIGVMGNLLKAPKGSELMRRTFEMADAIADENVPWLAMNRLLTRNVYELGLDRYVRNGIVNEGDADDVIRTFAASPFTPPPQSWYAIHWANEYWRTVAPAGAAGAAFPPKDSPRPGSLLHELYRAHGLVDQRSADSTVHSVPHLWDKRTEQPLGRSGGRSRLNMLLPTLNRGGAERIALDVATALCDDADAEIHLYVRRDSKRSHALPRHERLHVHFLDEPAAPSLVEMAQSIVKSGNPLIFTHLIPIEQLRQLWSVGLLTIPVIHNASQGWNESPQEFDEAHVPLIVACCDVVAAELRELRCKPPVVTIRHEICWSPRPRDLARARQSVRDRWGIEDDVLLLGMIGQFKSQKAYPRAVRVLAALQARVSAKLMIVGGWDHPYGWGRKTFEATMRQAVDLGVVADMILTGETDDPADYLAAFDVLLNTSVFEGLSLTIMEAIACGCPIVASDVGGIREIAVPDMRLVDYPSDVEAYCEAILAVAQRETRLIPPPPLSPELVPQIWSGVAKIAPIAGASPRPAPNGTLFVIDGLHLGGPAISLCRTLAARKRRHRVGVVALHGQSVEAYGDAIADAEAELFTIPIGISPARAAHYVLDLLLEQNFGTLCFWSAPAEVKLLVAKLLEPTGIAVVDVSPGPMLFDELEAESAFQRRIAFTDDQYFASLDWFISLYKDGLPSKYGKTCDRTALIPLGVPKRPRFVPLPPPELLPPPSFDPAFAMGAVTRLVPYKHVELLIDAMAILKFELPQANLTIVGGPDATSTDYAEDLYRRVAELGLTNVHFAGPYADVNRFLAMWKLFLLSGERQGCPNASLEAMAMGLPVIAFECGGLREQVLNGKTGYLVRSAVELASRAKSLLTDRERLASLSRQSRQRVRARFDLDASAARLAEILPI